MKKKFVYGIIGLMLVLIAQPVAGQPSLPEAGDLLPQFNMPFPKQDKDRQYLGIAGGAETFTPDQVDASVVIIEIFSMYCPYCQKEAPLVNRLYELVTADSTIRDKIRIFGIGIGNSSFEVGFFRKTYSVEFPMFPDSEFVIHKVLGNPRTPFFIVASKGEDGQLKVIHTKLGSIFDPGKFLEKILDLSKLN